MKSLLARLAMHMCMKRLSLALLIFSCFASAAEKDCADYQTGESRSYSAHAMIGFFGAPEISYQVTKLPDEKYLLEVNPKFFEMVSQTSPLGAQENKSQENPEGRERAKACFAWFNEKYSSLMTPQILLGVSASPRQINIQITKDPEFRSYLKKYNLKNMNDCAFIVHESLHLMGLWDEYVEDPRPNAKGLRSFNCRSISDSIMSDEQAYSRYFPLTNADGSPKAPLRPAHIRQILFPSCTERNPVYKACISNAYRSVGTILNCTPAPAVCGEKNTWLE